MVHAYSLYGNSTFIVFLPVHVHVHVYKIHGILVWNILNLIGSIFLIEFVVFILGEMLPTGERFYEHFKEKYTYIHTADLDKVISWKKWVKNGSLPASE